MLAMKIWAEIKMVQKKDLHTFSLALNSRNAILFWALTFSDILFQHISFLMRNEINIL